MGHKNLYRRANDSFGGCGGGDELEDPILDGAAADGGGGAGEEEEEEEEASLTLCWSWNCLTWAGKAKIRKPINQILKPY